ncbi:GNAT family N-acetyltransferase [Streptomyces sp. NA02950]|uniref:GNAT family N-acetyltransferase n=1 Tax=Streptomyces sp. NA02950 TaxID=2742137 RepID=UPI00158FC38E|nr:GNAT family N-acetyltransferase [Streptomyces sp. NA02950]QKV93485.1 GNAT family N-acetyltransferase [Streptomyces sp. NA02950]
MPDVTDGARSAVRLEPWEDDPSFLELLRRNNSPEMTRHLGGPESEEKLLDRHRRYAGLAESGRGRMYRVVLLPEEKVAGSIGFWEKEWRGGTVYETGWGVLPEFQGRGVAAAAARRVAGAAAAEGAHRWLHAFPSVDHPASNGVCRKAGFTLLGVCDLDYPAGNPIQCNDWRLELIERR